MTKAKPMSFYAIVTFGSPRRRFAKVHSSLDRALAVASKLKGVGTCSAVHVLEFAMRSEAKDADISDHRGLGVVGDLVASF